MAAAARRAKEKLAKKSKAKPKADPAQLPHEDDHATGLWVNWDFLRGLTKRSPQTIVHGAKREEDNRYLHLADVALRPEERRKRKREK